VGTGPSDDYYGLLGIDAEADVAGVRRAWRRLALRWHPDRAGPGATPVFQKILAAYTVLSDPVARAAYDRRRGAPARSPGVRASGASAPAAARRPTPGWILRRQCGNLNALIACGIARRAEGDVIELVLDTHEAAQGGTVSISMSVPIHCPACAANPTGPCTRCGTNRTLDEPFSAWLSVPAGVSDGTVLRPSALLSGMVRPVAFRLRIRGGT
jgi:DnaJ-class molecular chaperone